MAYRDLVRLAVEYADGWPTATGDAKPTYYPLPRPPSMDADPQLVDLNPICVPHKPLPSELALWYEAGLCPVWTAGTKRHPHGLLGAGRSIAEHAAIRLISEYAATLDRSVAVADVGSNAERLRTAVSVVGVADDFLKIHHLIPDLQSGDRARLLAARGRHPHCAHRLQECDCVVGYDVYLFQHSLYYFTPAEVLHQLGDQAIAIATVHHIFHAAGRILDQMAYQIRQDGFIEATARGNTHAYIHPPNNWLRAGRYTDGARTLTWELKSSHFETHVYRFDVTPMVIPNRHLISFDQNGAGDLSEDYLRRINGELESVSKTRELGPDHDPDMTAYVGTIRRVTLVYGMTYAYEDGERVVAMPTDLIGRLTTRAAQAPRDPTLRRTLSEEGKRFLSAGNHPPALIARVLLLAVMIAMTRDVDEETAHIGVLNRQYGPLFAEHARVLAGGAVASWRWYHWLDPRNWWAHCRTDEFASSDGLSYRHLRDAGLGPTPVGAVNVGVEAFPPIHGPKTLPLPPLARGSKLRSLPEERPPPRDPGMRLALVALGPLAPTSVRGSNEAFERAFRVRIARATPTPLPGVWDALWTQAQSHRSILRRLVASKPIEMTPGIRAQWLEKFPANQRGKFLNAIAELKTRDLTERDFEGSAMIKREKSGMCDAGGPPALDERLVIAYKPTRQVVTGPYDWMMAKTHRARLSVERDSPAVWVNGRAATAEAFGAWYVSAVASIPPPRQPWRRWGDQSKFEAHRDEGAFTFSKNVAFSFVQDERYRQARESSWILRGRGQRHAYRYRAEWKLGSGGTETSDDSMIRNLAALTHVFGEPSWGRLMFAVNGDDWLVLADREFPPDDFHRRMREVGFESSFDQSLDDTRVVFCQTCPYPVGGSVVWGPLIGRVLSRLPWALEHSKDDPRGVAAGMRVACSHIPFIVDYLDAIARLSGPVEAVSYDYHLAAVDSHVADDATYAFVHARYGLTRSDQLEFRRLLASVDKLHVAIDWPHLVRLAGIDDE